MTFYIKVWRSPLIVSDLAAQNNFVDLKVVNVESLNDIIMDEHNNTALRLEELSTSDFEIAEHQPDITGWLIKSASGDEIGQVRDLIFDREARKVRYIVGRIGLNEGDAKLVLIPIGIATLHENFDDVVIPEPSVSSLDTLPVYVQGTVISPAEEVAVRYAILGNDGLLVDTELPYHKHHHEFYDHHHFNDRGFTRPRNR